MAATVPSPSGRCSQKTEVAPARGRNLEISRRGNHKVAGQIEAQNRVGLLVRNHADRAGEGAERSRYRNVGRGWGQTIGDREFGAVGNRAALFRGKIQAIVLFAGVNHEAHVAGGRVDPVFKQSLAVIVESDWYEPVSVAAKLQVWRCRDRLRRRRR